MKFLVCHFVKIIQKYNHIILHKKYPNIKHINIEVHVLIHTYKDCIVIEHTFLSVIKSTQFHDSWN